MEEHYWGKGCRAATRRWWLVDFLSYPKCLFYGRLELSQQQQPVSFRHTFISFVTQNPAFGEGLYWRFFLLTLGGERERDTISCWLALFRLEKVPPTVSWGKTEVGIVSMTFASVRSGKG
jgi:hypothetical protein